MNALNYFLQFPWVEPLGWTLIHFLWQGAGIGALLWGALRILHSRRPVLRYAVACGAMLACVIAPLVTFNLLAQPFRTPAPVPARVLTNAPVAVPVGEGKASPASQTPGTITPLAGSLSLSTAQLSSSLAAPASQAPEPPSILRSIAAQAVRWIVPFWIAGLLLMGIKLAFDWTRLQWWRRGALSSDEAWLNERFSILLKRFGMSDRVRLLVSKSISGPMALGWIRPAVLLPVGLLTGLPREHIEAILAHELAHVRRHDYLVNLIQSAIEVALFYHPAVWWVGREIRQIREECCDEEAAAIYGDRMVYARALTGLAELRMAGSLAPAAVGGLLLSRITRLFGQSKADPVLSSRNAAWALTLACAVVTAAGILYSSRLMAQDSEGVANTKPAPRGIVVDENEHPVAGARVILYHAKDYWGVGNRVLEEVRSDSAGRFTFSTELKFAVPNGNTKTDHYIAFATLTSKAIAWSNITGGVPSKDSLTLKLTKPVTQTYEVVDLHGKPVEGATVWLRYAGFDKNKPGPFEGSFLLSEDLGLSSAVTDHAGKAVLANLPDTTYSVAASKTGCEDEMFCATPRDGVPRFTVKPGAVLEGRVLDPFGQPLEGAKVSLYPTFKWDQFFIGKTDKDGRYRIEKIWSNGSDPNWGKYKVRIEHPRFTAEEREVAFTSGQTTTGFDIRAEVGTELIGGVVDPATKQPVAGAKVTIDSKAGRNALRTDLEGKFRLHVPSGEFYAFIETPPGGHYYQEEKPNSHSARAFGTETPLVLLLPGRLGKLGVLHGKVLSEDGSPVPGGKVSVVVPGPFLIRPDGRGNAFGNVVTVKDGSFMIEEMPVDLPFTLFARDRDGKLAGIHSGAMKNETERLSESLIVHATTSAEITVLDVEGKPRANLTVGVAPVINGESVAKKEMKTDAKGQLRVPGVIPGVRYRLSQPSTRPYMEGYSTTIELVPAKTSISSERQTVTLSDRYVVRILGVDGQPVGIQRFNEYFVHIDFDGRRSKWSNGPLRILERRDNDVLVSRETLILGKAGDPIEFLLQTTDGSLLRAHGALPTDGSALIIANATEPGTLPEAVPDPTIADVKADEIAGRVLTPEGTPIPGIPIVFQHGWWQEGKPPIVTDDHGVFRVPDTKEKYFTFVRIVADGFAPVFLTDVPKGSGFKVTLQKNTRLAGTIGGENPGQVKIVLEKEKATTRERMGYKVRGIQHRAETDEHGVYDFPVEPGTYRFSLMSADGRFARGEISIPTGRTVSIPTSLQRGHGVTLQLIDCKRGTPVSGIKVRILEQGEDLNYRERPGSIKTSDEQGLLTWTNLMPGKTQFDAQYQDYSFGPTFPQDPYSRWWREEEPVEWRRIDYAKSLPQTRDGIEDIYVDVTEGMKPVRVLMERGVKVSGAVFGPDGQPAPDVTLEAVPHQGGRGTLTGGSQFQIHTDAKGEFAGYLPAGNGVAYNLCAYYSPHRSAPAASAVSETFHSKPGDEFEFRLLMTRGAWVTGRVVDPNGNPVADIEVQTRAEDHLDTAYADRLTKTDAQGRFRIGPLRPAEYAIQPDRSTGVNIAQIPGVEPKKLKVTNGAEVEIGDLVLPPEGRE